MKKIIRTLILVTSLIILTGCPMESEFPIDDPSIKVNKDWYGTYLDEHGRLYHMEDTPTTLIIGPKSDFEYTVKTSYLAKDSLGNLTNIEDNFTVHVSKVAKRFFLNVKNETGPYKLYKVEKIRDYFELTEVNDFMTKFNLAIANNSKELKDYLIAYVDDEDLYGESFFLFKE